MNPYYNESAFLQDLAILVNTDSGTGTVEGIDKIANFMMKKYADLGMWTEKKTFRADLGGNDIQQCALSGPVSAVKKRDIVELDLLQPFLREDLKRIERIVAGPFDRMQKPFLRCL